MFFSLATTSQVVESLFCDRQDQSVLMSYYYFGRSERKHFTNICRGIPIERTIRRRKVK